MALKQRKQITGTTAQINAYAGVEGQLVWDKTKKKWVGMSGTAGTNYPMASESHTHSIANVSGLQSALDGKANKAHTHAVADVDGLQTVLNTVNGKIPTKTSQLTNDSGFLTTHPTISVAAETLSAGSVATVTKSGTDAAPVFTFGIPKGADGAKGDKGDTGPRGPQGPAGSSAPTPNAYVTESWRSGNNWYRKWSNGFIEQGGLFVNWNGAIVRSFSLNTPFSSKNYVMVIYASQKTIEAPASYSGERSNTTFYVGLEELKAIPYLSWYACGY